MKKGKKILMFVSMVLILAVATVLNVVLLSNNTNSGGAGGTSTVGNFFATSRQDRLTTRNFEVAQLNEILILEGTEYESARTNAAAQKQKIVEAMELELLIETLLKAQGFEDVFVAVGAASDTVNVIVSRDQLTREDTVRIYNIIATEASVDPDFVSITAV